MRALATQLNGGDSDSDDSASVRECKDGNMALATIEAVRRWEQNIFTNDHSYPSDRNSLPT